MSKRRRYPNPMSDALIAAAAPYVVGGFALWLLYRKFIASDDAIIPAQIEKVKVAAGQIQAGLPGYIADKIAGRDESGYITREEQAAKAAANLAARKSGFADVVYGS